VCVCVCASVRACGVLQVKAIEVKKEITSVQLNCGGEVITFTAGTEVHFLDTTVSLGLGVEGRGSRFTPSIQRYSGARMNHEKQGRPGAWGLGETGATRGLGSR
jgi:hypothetical protein